MLLKHISRNWCTCLLVLLTFMKLRLEDCWFLLHLHVTVKDTVNMVVIYLIASRLSAKNMYTFLKNEYLFIHAYKIN